MTGRCIWRLMVVTGLLSLGGVVFFMVGFDHMQLRMLSYTLGQACRWRCRCVCCCRRRKAASVRVPGCPAS